MLIEKSVRIPMPAGEIYRYLLDFSQLYEWDDHVVEGWRVDLGPIGVGSKFGFKYSLAGGIQELEYTLEELEENKRLLFSCQAPSFSAVDTITLEAQGDEATEVHYKAEIDVGGGIKEFVFSRVMQKIGDGVVARMKEVLTKPETTAPSRSPLALTNLPYRFSTKGWNHRRKEFSATIARPGTILITGPTSGLGRSAALSLAGKGCSLILVARSEDKLSALETELRERGYTHEIHTYLCDMQDLSAVRKTCDKILADGHHIDSLINNAGALFAEAHPIDEIERTTVVDLLAPWIITCKLLPAMNRGSSIINVSSGGMYSARLSLSRLRTPETPFSGAKAYAYAKRAMHVFSVGLNTELRDRDIRIHCMHPGWADTPGVLTSLPGFHRITKRWLRTPFQGADTIVWLAMHNPLPGGGFWLDRQTQPPHILSSTEGNETDYTRLREFLDPFATPNLGETNA